LASHCKFLLGKVLLFFCRRSLGRANFASHVAKGLTKAARLRGGQKALRHGQHGGVKEPVLAIVKRLGKLGQRLLITLVGQNRFGIFARQIACRWCSCCGHLIPPQRR
jgi:hypothetical protein